MDRIIIYNIQLNNKNKTIGQFLKEQGFSHQVVVDLKKTENGIVLNDHWAYITERMDCDDILTLNIKETSSPSAMAPISIPLEIVFEDSDIMVINKPSNMPIHPSMGNHENTLANALAYYFRNEVSPFVFRCINRLDRDTTGLTIIAKNPLSAAILGRQIANREIHRTYIAICDGNISSNGTISAPIAREDTSTIKRCVNFEKGEQAVTNYWKLSYRPDINLSLVKLQLETGRTHQIRVHMGYIDHPLIGDFLYHPQYDHIPRQALHSSSLDFFHPITKEEMHFHVPLPFDMKRIFPSF